MDIEKHDNEGRVLTAEFEDFFLVSCYTPCSGIELERLDYRVNEWDVDFFSFVNGMKESGKGVVVCGDLNVGIAGIDHYSKFKKLDKYPGSTDAERNSILSFFKSCNFIDTFRYLNPEERKYSFYNHDVYKSFELNHGWRLDYFLINEELKCTLEEAHIHK